MQTYPVESPKPDLSALAHLAAKGQEVLLTEHDRPLAKIVPLDEDEAYRQEVRALMGSLSGMRSFERDDNDRI